MGNKNTKFQNTPLCENTKFHNIIDSLRYDGLTQLVVFDKYEQTEKNFYIKKLSVGYFVSTGYVGKHIYDIQKFIRNIFKNHPYNDFRIHIIN